MANIDLYGSDELKEATKQAEQAHENRRKVIEGLKDQVKSSSGSGGMRDMMGASKKSKSGGGSKDKDKDKDKKE